MITVNDLPVRVVGVHRKELLASVEFQTGAVSVVPWRLLKGTTGGALEVALAIKRATRIGFYDAHCWDPWQWQRATTKRRAREPQSST